MPAWMLMAMQGLRSASFGGPGRALMTGAGTGVALAEPSGGLLPFSPFGGLFGGGRDKVHRHRRKRLLTQQMKDDIAYITAMLGAPAGKQAMLIAVSK